VAYGSLNIKFGDVRPTTEIIP